MSLSVRIPRGLRGIFLFLLLVPPLAGQTLPPRAFLPASADRYSITEKSSMRQRIDGRYQGFVYHEVRGSLIRDAGEPGGFSGSFYILKTMVRDQRNVALPIDTVQTVTMSYTPDGRMQILGGGDYPLLRDFPRLPAKPIAVGERWRSEGVRVVDPLRGEGTRVPFLAEYEYMGIAEYNGVDAHIIKAQYAVRYRGGEDPYGDPELRSLQGRHVVDIYLPTEAGVSAFMRDLVDEIYQYGDGSELTRSGFILTWFEDFEPLDRGGIRDEVERVVREQRLEDVVVEERDEGVAISLRNLRFYPDSPRLLPGELDKLRSMAQVLKGIPERGLLVTGHTADVGSVESQLTLSVERAQAVIARLVEEGVDPERFIYRGLGGSQPIAPNDTEAGRALNRRVEITILED